MFKLEERLIGDKEIYFKDLVKAYNKELKNEEFLSLQEKLRLGGDDADALLKQMYDLKRG
jgi:hypothetical protein